MSRRRDGRGEGSPDRVGDLLGGVLRKLGVSEEVARQGAIERWGEVVGERIAAVTEAVSVANGVLFVRVSSSAWLNELTLMRSELLSRLNAGRRDGRIDRIVLTLAEGPPRAAGGGAGPGPSPPREDGGAPSPSGMARPPRRR